MYSPQDTLIGPIVDELADIIENQIEGVSRVYRLVPDNNPENNSAVIPLTKYDVISDTNGKLYLKMLFGIRHLVRRSRFEDNIQDCYMYLAPYLLAFSAWDNQTLNGKSMSVEVTQGGVTQYVESGQVYTALVVNVAVLTEFNIPTS
ncbi:hypothetical protein [Ktedonospora formicarum]|uniref:Uncharacterized protein n=1 Tax=Ktedonospora formicarum TaxID=2778364 RepID=A0A8J3MQ55_9CHLR|nr:hypothetical protein [Ktedonospora formicarum]GHO44517.1 hypothetical protein KSX_26800 [Ktedonospora formicarum]